MSDDDKDIGDKDIGEAWISVEGLVSCNRPPPVQLKVGMVPTGAWPEFPTVYEDVQPDHVIVTEDDGSAD